MIHHLLLLLGCTAGNDLAERRETATEGSESEDSKDSAGADSGSHVDPEDQDGDGVREADGDCDDHDARVHPGAPDGCDAVDQDCDGIAQPEGSCSRLVMLEASNAGAWVGDGRGSLLTIWEADTDYDLDGVVDVLAYELCTDWAASRWCNQNVLFVPGRLPDGEEVLPVAGSPFWIADPEHDWTADVGNVGDFDGDGSTDLFIAARGCAPDDGSLYLMLGPTTRWPTAGATTRATADGWWVQAEADDCFADEASGGYDADGDGLDDLIVSGAQIAFVRGRTTGLTQAMPIRDETWFEGDSESFALLPDLDGDGLGEAAIRYYDTANHLALLPPATLSDGSAGVGLADVADVVELGVDVWFDLFDGRSELGDVDGDGLTDIAITVARNLSGGKAAPWGHCSAVLFGSGLLRDEALDLSVDRLVCVEHDEASTAEPDRLSDDVDGDGVPDVLINAPYGAGERIGWLSCIVASGRRPEAGWELLEDVRPYCFDVEGDQEHAGAAIDLDNDGLPEILGTEVTYGGNRGHIVVAPGFAIPFEDDSRW